MIQHLKFHKRYLLYVGSRTHYKNFTGLLEYFREWKGCFQTDLVIVGSPWTSKEIQLMEQYNLTKRVHLLDQVDDILLCQLYNQAQAFIFPSHYEGFGIPILEALACGCPVVASRIPSSLEVGKDSLYYFDLDKPETFFSALDKAISEGHTPKRIQRGLNLARTFSWEITARKTLEVYKQLLK